MIMRDFGVFLGTQMMMSHHVAVATKMQHMSLSGAYMGDNGDHDAANPMKKNRMT
jgi:hypothetical protein